MSDQKNTNLLLKRCLACFIDMVIIGIISVICGFTLGLIPYLGGILVPAITAVLILVRDALPIADLAGASPGKKLLNLKAVKDNGQNCDYEASIKRNLPLAAYSILGAALGILWFIGSILTIILLPIGLLVLIAETIKMFIDPKSQRFGDLFAATSVIEVTPANASKNQAPPPPPAPPVPPPGDSQSEDSVS